MEEHKYQYSNRRSRRFHQGSKDTNFDKGADFVLYDGYILYHRTQRARKCPTGVDEWKVSGPLKAEEKTISEFSTALLTYPEPLHYKGMEYNDFPPEINPDTKSTISTSINLACLASFKRELNYPSLINVELETEYVFPKEKINLDHYLNAIPKEPPQERALISIVPEPPKPKPAIPEPLEPFEPEYQTITWYDILFPYLAWNKNKKNKKIRREYLQLLGEFNRWDEDDLDSDLDKYHKIQRSRQQGIKLNSQITKYNQERKEYWQIECKRLKENALDQYRIYQRDADKFNKIQDERYQLKDKLLKLSSSKKGLDIGLWWDFILSYSDLPQCLPIGQKVHADIDSKILIFSLNFPDLSKLEILKTRELVTSTKTVFANKGEAKSALKEIFFGYPVRLAWEISHSSILKNFDSVVINSIVNRPDPATGQPSTICIGSVMVDLNQIKSILIDKVDFKETYKMFKGVYNGEPHDVIDTIPVLSFNENENRFVEGKSVVEDVIGTNLAAIDWEDFEHLIRELFEKEFGENGAEVKVTRASRDKGVDAIILDKDPIRGGKFIIQAKRYTNTVDVSAVRDLYGTTLNEGANRGILVTTSNYGPDAYNFVKDKPLTLLNGRDLLSLLKKHGFDCYIDIQQARKMLGL